MPTRSFQFCYLLAKKLQKHQAPSDSFQVLLSGSEQALRSQPSHTEIKGEYYCSVLNRLAFRQTLQTQAYSGPSDHFSMPVVALCPLSITFITRVFLQLLIWGF